MTFSNNHISNVFYLNMNERCLKNKKTCTIADFKSTYALRALIAKFADFINKCKHECNHRIHVHT